MKIQSLKNSHYTLDNEIHEQITCKKFVTYPAAFAKTPRALMQGVLLQRGIEKINLDQPLFKQGFNSKDLMYAAIFGKVPSYFCEQNKRVDYFYWKIRKSLLQENTVSYIYLPCNLYKAWSFGQFLMHFDRLWGVDLARNLEDDWRAEERAAMAVPQNSEERCQTLEGLTELHGLRIPTDYEHLRLPLSLKKLRYTNKNK